MIFGHLTVTAAVHHLVKRRIDPSRILPLGPLLVGAYLPDLMDKPTALVTGLSGRGYGHSLVLQAALFALLAWPLRRWARPLAALGVGVLAHLLEDWVPLPVLLAPLLGPIPYIPQVPLLEKLRLYYTSGGVQMWIEVAAVLYWVAVAWATKRPCASSPASPTR